MSRDIPNSTIGTLVSELRDEGITLLRQEIALAKAELSEKASEAGKSAVAIATGGAVAYAGGIVLLIGVGHLAVHGLTASGVSEDLATWLGFVLVGAVVAVIGWSMLAAARKKLSAANLKPTETVASLRDSQRWAQNKIHPTNEPAH